MKMTEEHFWDIIAKVDWPGLCLKDAAIRNAGNTDENIDEDDFDPCEVGKEILMELLPTLQASEEFRTILFDKIEHLVDTISQLEVDGIVLDLGDDSTNDLVYHIIGCGKEEYLRSIDEPMRIRQRVHAGRFVESFSYCMPYQSDYDPIETKIEEAEQSLAHWIEQRFYRTTEPWLDDEVGRRATEVAKLQATKLGQKPTKSVLNDLVIKAKNKQTFLVSQKLLEDLKKQEAGIKKMADEIEISLKKAKDWLDEHKE